jgi:hypothetical protein
MLVVLAIIVIVLLAAVPVFNSLTGNHSVAAAQNQVAAMLVTARADAIYDKQITGVFFFIDPASDSVAMAEVQADPQVTGGVTYTPLGVVPAPTPPNGSADLINGAASPPPNNGPVTALEMVNYYTPIQSPNNAGAPTGLPTSPGTFTYYRDVIVLPASIGIALYNNYYGYTYASVPSDQSFDRYVRLGAILFDANGNLTACPYAVQQTRYTPYQFQPTGGNLTYFSPINHLGQRLGLTTASGGTPQDLASIVPNPPTNPVPIPSASGNYPLISSVGLLFYDRNAFLNQHTTNQTYSGQPFTDLDLNYLLPGQSWAAALAVNPQAPAAQKSDEENWLDQNGIAVMVSPNDGSLITAK